LSALTGCAGARYSQTQQDLVVMQARVAELERVNGRNRVLLEEMEERVFLLQDRVEAARLALQRRDSAPPAASASAGQPVGGFAPYQPFPSASAPAVTPQNSTYPMPSLPVQRLGPQGAIPAPSPAPMMAEEEGEEVVITMETLEARFGSEMRLAARMERESTGDTWNGPVGGDSLPVVPINRADAVAAVSAAGSTAPPATDAATPNGGLSDYRAALDLFNAGQYADALSRLQSFVNGAPEADYMDNALFWMGECHYGLGHFEQALGYFQRVVSEYPDGNKVPDSLLKVALSHERLSNTSEAIDILGVLAETYPATDAARRASERLRALQ
jgi:tol-pal system protein YbgF